MGKRYRAEEIVYITRSNMKSVGIKGLARTIEVEVC